MQVLFIEKREAGWEVTGSPPFVVGGFSQSYVWYDEGDWYTEEKSWESYGLGDDISLWRTVN